MRGGEVNVGVVGIVNAAALAVRVVGSGEIGEVASDPGVDA